MSREITGEERDAYLQDMIDRGYAPNRKNITVRMIQRYYDDMRREAEADATASQFSHAQIMHIEMIVMRTLQRLGYARPGHDDGHRTAGLIVREAVSEFQGNFADFGSRRN